MTVSTDGRFVVFESYDPESDAGDVRDAARRRETRERLRHVGRAELSFGDPPADPDGVVGAVTARRQVRAALDALSPKERRALLMREEGFKHREIAEALGMALPGSASAPAVAGNNYFSQGSGCAAVDRYIYLFGGYGSIGAGSPAAPGGDEASATEQPPSERSRSVAGRAWPIRCSRTPSAPGSWARTSPSPRTSAWWPRTGRRRPCRRRSA